MTRFIIAILGMLVAGSVFFLYTKPTYDTIKLIQQQIGQYDQALQRANELQERKQELLTRYNAFNPGDLDRLQKLLPDHVDNVRLVLDFDNLASKHGLAIQNVSIGRGASDGATKSAAAIQALGGDNKNYDSLTLKFSTQGTYDSFVTFMDDVQASLRIVDLVALSLSPAGKGDSVAGEEAAYRFDVTIRTYWLK